MKMKTDQNGSDSGRAMFATRFGAIAATVGSAVGLGNIWRFPYEAGANGGGAFLICYVAFIFMIGVPLLCAEFAMGRGTRSNIFGAYHRLQPRQSWRLAGYMGILASLMILSFYSVVAGWTMEYTVQSAAGNLDFATEATGHSQFQTLTTGWRPLVWTLLFLGCNFGVLIGGVTKGIERASNVLMPVLFLLLAAFCVNSFTLPGFGRGMAFLFTPDFSKITPSVLLSAMGQAFFTLSLGLGCMVTYASYFGPTDRLGRTAVTTAMLDTLVAVLAGVIIFPAVFTYGVSPQAGPTLVFEVLPYVFSHMPAGRLWSTLFFLLLFLASLTSTVSMSEISISYFCEEKGWSRRRATVVSTLIALAGGTLCALSFGALSGLTVCGLTVFSLMDYLSSNVCLPLGGMIVSVFMGRVVKRRYLYGEMCDHGRTRFRLLGLLVFALRWICPVAILLIFLNSIGLIEHVP